MRTCPSNDSHCFEPEAAALASNVIRVWFASSAGLVGFDADQLTLSERERFERLRTARRRKEFALAHVLRGHLPVSAVTSLSHSGGHVAMVQGQAERDIELGVDLEIHRERDFLSLARFCFSACEAAALEDSEPPERMREFYLRWVIKEAFAKALQWRLLTALRHCVVRRESGRYYVATPTSRPWTLAVFEPRAQSSLAVVHVSSTPVTTMGRCAVLETYEWPPTRRVPWPLLLNAHSDGVA